MTESLPNNEPTPQPAPKSPGRVAMERVLEEIEKDKESLRHQVDEAAASSPDKEPFDVDSLATVYPMDKATLSEEAVEEFRTKYYLFFSGNTIEEYADHLIYHDMHGSN